MRTLWDADPQVYILGALHKLHVVNGDNKIARERGGCYEGAA